MELELHQLDRRYESLRTRSAWRERRLLASMAQVGQQTPIVVVRDGAQWVVVDGYKRVRVVQRLGQDVVVAAEWLLGELDAVVLERVMRDGDGDSAIEQGWLLRELMLRFGLGCDEIGRRFDRSASWVSRRLGLVSDLPVSIQDQVRAGAIGAHAAMKYLVPLARANRAAATTLIENLGQGAWSVRQIARVYEAWKAAKPERRAEIAANPRQAVAISEEMEKPDPLADPDAALAFELVKDLRILSAVIVRARPRLACLPTAKSRVEPTLIRTRHDLDLFVRELEAHLGEEACHGSPARH